MSEREGSTATAALAREGWRMVAASVRGPAHAARERPREDAFAIRIVSRCAIAVVCDGAGSASCAAAGATGFSASVLNALATAVEGFADGDFAVAFQEAVADGIDRQRIEILRQGLDLRDHHATLMAVAVTPSRSLIAHLGDGLVGITPDADWADAGLSLPENGEFANETFFVTEDDWRDHLRFLEGPPFCRREANCFPEPG